MIEGYGNSSKLFFSDYSRPFDQITLDLNFRKIYGKVSAINLDKMLDQNRYLYMHTLGFKSKRFDFTIGETILSTGLNESLNIKYLNPFNFWSWENTGSTTKD